MAARIQVPSEAKRGDVVTVRLVLQHPMETGYRHDETGKTVPKNVVRSLVCRYDGVEVFNGRLSPGIAANPYLEFDVVARESGDLEFTWTDDAGTTETARQTLTVR